MKISELKKGDIAEMKNVGQVKVLGVAKTYLRLQSDSMNLKIQFADNGAPISDLGLIFKAN